MDTRKDAVMEDETNEEYQPRTLHESYCPKNPPEIPNEYYRPYTQPSGVLRLDEKRRMYFYTTVNTPNATKELLDQIADKPKECKIL